MVTTNNLFNTSNMKINLNYCDLQFNCEFMSSLINEVFSDNKLRGKLIWFWSNSGPFLWIL